MLCHPLSLIRKLAGKMPAIHTDGVEIDDALVANFRVHPELDVPATAVASSTYHVFLVGAFENFDTVKVHTQLTVRALGLLVVDLHVVPRVRFRHPDEPFLFGVVGPQTVSSLVIKLVVPHVADAERAMRVVHDLPLRDDDGIIGHRIPVQRREVKACRVVHVITLVIPVRNGTELAAVGGVLAARNGTSEPKFASVGVHLQHAVALARPGRRLDLMIVQLAVSIVDIAVPRRVPVHSALAFDDVVGRARIAAPLDARISVQAEAGLHRHRGAQVRTSVGKPALPIQRKVGDDRLCESRVVTMIGEEKNERREDPKAYPRRPHLSCTDYTVLEDPNIHDGRSQGEARSTGHRLCA